LDTKSVKAFGEVATTNHFGIGRSPVAILFGRGTCIICQSYLLLIPWSSMGKLLKVTRSLLREYLPQWSVP
jgi:hypothetical protein